MQQAANAAALAAAWNFEIAMVLPLPIPCRAVVPLTGINRHCRPPHLPYHHRRVLHYCRELGVKLEVYVMETMANVFQTTKAFGGKPQIRRAIANDVQGYIAEMLAKAVNQKSLNEELNE